MGFSELLLIQFNLDSFNHLHPTKKISTDDILLQRKIFQFSNNNLAKKYVDSLCTIIRGLLNTGVEKSKII